MMKKQQPLNETMSGKSKVGAYIIAGVIIIALLVLGYWWGTRTTDVPSDFDESELPALPFDEGETVREEKLPVLDESPSVKEKEVTPAESSATKEFAGSWSVYSERLFYDRGGGGATLSASSGTASTRTLSLKSDGSWEYGTSKGTWSVGAITAEDWKTWGIESYGPTRKVILAGWNKGTASGPVEESAGRIDFIWVLYRVEPPTVQNPGTVHMKFGH